MSRHKPKPKVRLQFEAIEQRYGNEDGDPRVTPPDRILANNQVEHKKRADNRLRIQLGKEYGDMGELIGHKTDPERILPSWLKDVNGGRGKERR